MSHPLWSLLCLLALAVAGPAATLGPRLETVRVAGRDYHRLSDWTRPNGFELTWLVKDKVVVAHGKNGRMRFEVDSRKAQINGVNLTLAFPVALKGGEAHLSPIDLRLYVRPLIFPPRHSDGSKVVTVCLDPGHGGKDPGNVAGTRLEKDFTLLLSRELATQLRTAGYKVVTTRSQDEYLDLAERAAFAERNKADLFISLHFNSAASTAASGVEVFCLTPAGAPSSHARPEAVGGGADTGNRFDERNILLAHLVQREMVRTTQAEDRGVLRARFAVLRSAKMPAILAEGGFMSNTEEGRKIYDTAYRRQIAEGIVAGVNAYKKTVER